MRKDSPEMFNSKRKTYECQLQARRSDQEQGNHYPFLHSKAGKFPTTEYNEIPLAVLTIAEKYSRSSTNNEEEEEEDQPVH
jgi:hypothetical protein